MKRVFLLIIVCFMILMTKYVLSGAYFDYKLRANLLLRRQSEYIDTNKRHIAELESYRSANYLFSRKDMLNMEELVPEKTILVKEPIVAHDVLQDEK